MVAASAARFVVLASISAAALAGCRQAEKAPPSHERNHAAPPVVGSPIAVARTGASIEGLAVGRGAVWVSVAGGRVSSVRRVDAERGKIVATVPVRDFVGDVAVGAGAVWATGGVADGPLPEDPDVSRVRARLYRIDRHSNEVVATIPLDPPPGLRPDQVFAPAVAVGEGAVWVSVSFGPRAGELVRLDPRTNEVIARIPIKGDAGELVVGGGAVWLLSHPEWTDEASGRPGRVIRVDPDTNQAATAWRGRLLALAGDEIAPLIAAGEDAVWVRSNDPRYPFGPIAIRIDTHTNDVARHRLSFRWFYPFAVGPGGVWFLGRQLSRLDPRDIRVDESLDPGIDAIDAALDPSGHSVWVASLTTRRGERAALVRVDVR
jgi:hypothetical protein